MMNDICKCKGSHCPIKEECYRYRCAPDLMGQSWFADKAFYDKKKNMCPYYMNCKTKIGRTPNRVGIKK